MKYIAHRGVVKEGIKENTVLAFQEAINDSNYVGFELDIRVSSDGVFVVHHNTLIDGSLVKRLTYEELKKKGVNSLDEVLELKTDKIVLLEIKDFDINLKKLVKKLNKSSLNIWVMSFSNKVIEELSEIPHNFKIGTLNYILNSEKDYSYNNFICLLYFSITDSLLEYFNDNGIDVVMYGIPNHAKVKENSAYMIINDEYLELEKRN